MRAAILFFFILFLGSCNTTTAPKSISIALSPRGIIPESVLEAAPDPAGDIEKKDLEELLKIQSGRKTADCKKAREVSEANPKDLFGKKSGILTKKQVKNAKDILKAYYEELEFAAEFHKEKWKRLRPFVKYSQVQPCINKPNSYSYPSFHATTFMGWALLLAEIYPDKKTQLLKAGEEAGWERVIGGVHYPSDIKAGQQLAKNVLEQLLKQPRFAAKLESLKSEK